VTYEIAFYLGVFTALIVGWIWREVRESIRADARRGGRHKR
jgi:hypothetical protein